MAPKVKLILKAEEAVVEKDSTDPATGAEAAAHLEQLLQDLFAGTEKKSVYMGKTYDHLYLWYTCVHVRVCMCVCAYPSHISHVQSPHSTRLRRRPAQYRQCVGRDVRLPLPLQPRARRHVASRWARGPDGKAGHGGEVGDHGRERPQLRGHVRESQADGRAGAYTPTCAHRCLVYAGQTSKSAIFTKHTHGRCARRS